MFSKNLLIIGLVLIVLVAGCTQLDQFQNIKDKLPITKNDSLEIKTNSPGNLGCGQDIDCFITAANTCKSSNVTWNFKVDLGGLVADTTNYMEIKPANGKCNYYQRTEKQVMTFSEDTKKQMRSSGLSDDKIKEQETQANEFAKATVGLSVSCNFENSKVVQLLNNWKHGNFGNELNGPECTITLPDNSGVTNNNNISDSVVKESELSTEGKICSSNNDCNKVDELCVAKACAKVDDIKSSYPKPPCSQPCIGCKSGKTYLSSISYYNISVEFCSECSEGSSIFKCRDTYICKGVKCVLEEAAPRVAGVANSTHNRPMWYVTTQSDGVSISPDGKFCASSNDCTAISYNSNKAS
ncbi:MAG: hypothetical protein Q7S22_02380, partial [Candidatus Micrarchaeota archaeon]|nr:hypothetical protein [Candidatus Micrarchaeota archaeon]